MAQSYTPGLQSKARTVVVRRRVLPLAGEVLVQLGQSVAARDIVARTSLPGALTPINAARALSVLPGELPGCLLKKAGDRIVANEVLARSPGIFGWFPAECSAPVTGTLESASSVTGQIILRGDARAVELSAYLTGRVVEVVAGQGVVVEGEATLVQGIFGIGGEAYGPIRAACDDPAQNLTADRLHAGLSGAIVFGGARVTVDALARAVELKVPAIITGGIDDADLRDFLGYDLGVATTGSEQVGLSLLLTEGFGDIAMARRTFDLFVSREGAPAALNGATQIRAGVLRPEVLIPWPEGSRHGNGASENSSDRGDISAGLLKVGAAVRIIRDPHFGIIGTVISLPAEARLLESGSKARVLEVEDAAKRRLVVPRANVELLEG